MPDRPQDRPGDEMLRRRRRVTIARVLALAADAVQIGLMPLFAEGWLSPLNDVLDLAVGATLVALLGWHWVFLPAFLTELVPMVDLVPTWTAAVFLVTRGGGAKPAGAAAGVTLPRA